MRFLGHKLKNLRNILDLSLTEVSKMTDIGAGHLSDIENANKNPRPETAIKICKALNVDEQYFYIEDTGIKSDLLPEMPDKVQKFIMQKENTHWLILIEKAKTQGVSSQVLEKIIDALSTDKKQNKKSHSLNEKRKTVINIKDIEEWVVSGGNKHD